MPPKDLSDHACGRKPRNNDFKEWKSIGTETIENDEDYIKYKYSEEERKQDCEIKAFKRLVKKIKQAFPRLPICIVADGLYVAENIMDLCESYHWKFIIRYKEGCAKKYTF